MSWGKDGSEVQYECVHCGQVQTEKDLENRGGRIKCINCGYKVLKKLRPPVVRKASSA